MLPFLFLPNQSRKESNSYCLKICLVILVKVIWCDSERNCVGRLPRLSPMVEDPKSCWHKPRVPAVRQHSRPWRDSDRRSHPHQLSSHHHQGPEHYQVMSLAEFCWSVKNKWFKKIQSTLGVATKKSQDPSVISRPSLVATNLHHRARGCQTQQRALN